MVWFFVAAGGALGSTLRYGLSLVLKHEALAAGPGWLPTLTVNVIGSFLLGFLMVSAPDTKVFGVALRYTLGIGVLGGFTTYSSFNYELLVLFEEGEYAKGALYAGSTLLLALAFGALGMWVARSA